MADMSKLGRAKISTTIAAENYRFLTALVKNGSAASLAEAVDEAVACFRRNSNRQKLARATAEYFASLSPEATAEERSLAVDLHNAASGFDFDREL